MKQQSNTTLFWALVIGIFFIIFLLWLPNFVGNIKTLGRAIQESSKQTADLRQEWAIKSDEIKKTFDSFVQKQTSLLNSAGTTPKNEPSSRDTNNKEINETLK